MRQVVELTADLDGESAPKAGTLGKVVDRARDGAGWLYAIIFDDHRGIYYVYEENVRRVL